MELIPVRRAVLILLLAVGCTSSGTKPRMAIDLSELHHRNQPATTAGAHLYRVQIRNESDGAITIESIRLDLVGTTDFEINEATQSFQRTLEPNESETFEMFVTISRRGTASLQNRIDSLRVTISGHGDHGGFVDSSIDQVYDRIP
ncbi:MAG TPA: hypothetical protein VII12_06695 [Thermoanaerobaculia bacterium]